MAADILASSPDIDLRKRWALMQLQTAGDTSSVRHPLQAVARALQGAMGGYIAGQAEADDKAAGAALFSGGLPGMSPQQLPTPSAAPPTTAPMPQPSAPSDTPMSANPPTTLVGNNPNYGVPRGIRNNNPGNIEDGPFARRMPGYAGSDGRFAKFAAPENGSTAIDSLLASYGGRGIDTVGGVINRWAPPTDNNPTSAYAATVAKGMGIDPNAKIDLSDPATRQKLGMLIGKFENVGAVERNPPVQLASLGGGGAPGMPAAPQVPPAGPQMAQAPQPLPQQPGMNPPAANRSSVQIPADVQATIQRLGADPRTRPQAMQLYMQYAKPVDQWQQYKAPDGTLLQKNSVTGEVKAAGTENQAINETQYAQQNWKQLGFPDPNSGDQKSKDFWQSYNSKRLGGSGVNVSLSTEKKGQEELASKGISAYTDAQFAAREAQKRIGIYDRMDKAAEAFKPGASADIRLTGQRWLKELGVNAGENVPEGEVLKMLSQQLAIHAQPKGQGAVSNFEREMFSKSLPNMTQSPEGFRKAVGISRNLEQFDQNVAKIYRDSAREHGGIPNYLDVQDKIAALGSPLSDSQMSEISGGAKSAAGSVPPPPAGFTVK